jgi:hypothetical protein
VTRRARRRSFLVAPFLCLLVAAALPSWASKKGAKASDPNADGGKAGKQPKVSLILQASPRHGFDPLDVTLYARLEGVPDGEKRFCHAGVEWIGETPNGRVMRSTEDARCLHPPDVTRVEHSFSKALHIERPATYRYHVILHLKDGGTVRSNEVEVRVISSH